MFCSKCGATCYDPADVRKKTPQLPVSSQTPEDSAAASSPEQPPREEPAQPEEAEKPEKPEPLPPRKPSTLLLIFIWICLLSPLVLAGGFLVILYLTDISDTAFVCFLIPRLPYFLLTALCLVLVRHRASRLGTLQAGRALKRFGVLWGLFSLLYALCSGLTIMLMYSGAYFSENVLVTLVYLICFYLLNYLNVRAVRRRSARMEKGKDARSLNRWGILCTVVLVIHLILSLVGIFGQMKETAF